MDVRCGFVVLHLCLEVGEERNLTFIAYPPSPNLHNAFFKFISGKQKVPYFRSFEPAVLLPDKCHILFVTIKPSKAFRSRHLQHCMEKTKRVWQGCDEGLGGMVEVPVPLEPAFPLCPQSRLQSCRKSARYWVQIKCLLQIRKMAQCGFSS